MFPVERVKRGQSRGLASDKGGWSRVCLSVGALGDEPQIFALDSEENPSKSFPRSPHQGSPQPLPSPFWDLPVRLQGHLRTVSDTGRGLHCVPRGPGQTQRLLQLLPSLLKGLRLCPSQGWPWACKAGHLQWVRSSVSRSIQTSFCLPCPLRGQPPPALASLEGRGGCSQHLAPEVSSRTWRSGGGTPGNALEEGACCCTHQPRWCPCPS